MWDHTVALGRVAALALFTVVFAAVWANDRTTQAEFALARRQAWGRSPDAIVVSSPQARATSPVSAHCRMIRRVTIEGALPREIAPGRYRIVDARGETFTIIVGQDGSG